MDVAQQFGLRADPFAPSTAGGDAVESAALVRARDELLARLRNGARLAVIVGDPGAGKSALLRSAAARVQSDGFSVERVVHAQQLERALEGPAEVLMVDEADALDDDRLRALIAAAESPRRTAVVMSARPEGVARLDVPVQPVVLRRLTSAEARAFLLGHIERAGGSPELFERGALDALVEAARGSPRLLRALGAGALLEASLDGAGQVSELHARRAVGMQLASGTVEPPRRVAESASAWVGASDVPARPQPAEQVEAPPPIPEPPPAPEPQAAPAEPPPPEPAPLAPPIAMSVAQPAPEPPAPTPVAPIDIRPSREPDIVPPWPPPERATRRPLGLLPLFLGAALSFALTPLTTPLLGADPDTAADPQPPVEVAGASPAQPVSDEPVPESPAPQQDLARVVPQEPEPDDLAQAEPPPEVTPTPPEPDEPEQVATAATAPAPEREADQAREETAASALRPAFTPIEAGKRVFVHYAPRQAGARDLAQYVAEQLEARGWTVADVRAVEAPVRRANARYFYRNDQTASRALESELERLLNARGVEGGSRLMAMTDYRPLPRPGTLEIWVPGEE